NAAASVLKGASAMSSSSSSPVQASSSSGTTVSAMSHVSQAATSISTASSIALHSGLPAGSIMPGLPGQAASPVLSSSPSVSSAAMGSFSHAMLRPAMPVVPHPSNPAVQPQAYTPYATIPTPGASPQPLWLQPPQMGGLRPPFLAYPPAYPGPFGLAARGVSLPSVPVPDAQPPGITPVGNPGIARPSSSSTPGFQIVSSTVMQSEVPPPGTDNSKVADASTNGDAAQNDQSDAWSAHRSETGAVYYYNAITGESTYERPLGFKGEPAKATTQPTPIAWEKVAGTDWALVSTNDGKNSWQVPSEVTDLRKKQESDSMKENSMSVPNSNVLNEKGYGPTSLSAPALNTGGRDAIPLRVSGGPGSSSALDLIKKKLQESGTQVTSFSTTASSGAALLEVNGSKTVEPTAKGLQSEGNKDKLRDAEGDGNVSDLSSDSEDEDSGPTKEERIAQFKEMLKERGVVPFSKWDKELPKIVFDPRFKAIPTYAERRSLFDHYVRTRAEEERKEKRAAQKAAVEGFKQLLEEAKEEIDHTTDYHTFRKRWGHDPRFEALERKDREALLNERSLSCRVLSLKRAAEEKAQAERAVAVSNFKSMLREKGDIAASSRWHLGQSQNLNLRKIHKGVHPILIWMHLTWRSSARETEDGRTVLNSWSTAKRCLKSDPRYTKVPRKDREALWKRHAEELQRKKNVTVEQKGDKYNESNHKNPNDSRRPSSASRSGQDWR
ncbi:Pre-mRNA-processing protein 40C, partial [Bienertia sinuspersici]